MPNLLNFWVINYPRLANYFLPITAIAHSGHQISTNYSDLEFFKSNSKLKSLTGLDSFVFKLAYTQLKTAIGQDSNRILSLIKPDFFIKRIAGN